ncbi:cytidine deaminase [Celerinatantimonas yamalensis]|uniref:Cytidine deaminase n=1 Tax=Celerinatantimonas yamalensis TaxID=559956 RepID=A0ABW9G346_9GAMM
MNDNLNIDQLALSEAVKQAWHQQVGPQRTSRLDGAQIKQLTQSCQLSIVELAEQLLPIAASYAVTPISHFNVGAIAIDQHGQLFMGANYEQTQVPLSLTLHAEQAALFNALNHAAAPLRHLVVNAAPCGHCRQFIRELPEYNNLDVSFSGQHFQFEQLLPHSFGPNDLGISVPLISYPETTDVQSLSKHSYAPYSHCQIGLLAKRAETPLASSWYVENAAFNPSASPLTLLLSQLHLNGYQLAQVESIDIACNQASISFQDELNTFCALHPQIKIQKFN